MPMVNKPTKKPADVAEAPNVTEDELSDEALEKVSGGVAISPVTIPSPVIVSAEKTSTKKG